MYACVCVSALGLPQVTEHVAMLSRWVAADLFAKEIDILQFELSMPRCNVDLWDHVQAVRSWNRAESTGGQPCIAVPVLPPPTTTAIPPHGVLSVPFWSGKWVRVSPAHWQRRQWRIACADCVHALVACAKDCRAHSAG